jgi:hypothetical protein
MESFKKAYHSIFNRFLFVIAIPAFGICPSPDHVKHAWVYVIQIDEGSFRMSLWKDSFQFLSIKNLRLVMGKSKNTDFEPLRSDMATQKLCIIQLYMYIYYSIMIRMDRSNIFSKTAGSKTKEYKIWGLLHNVWPS